jgi:hypothetical protein
MRNHVASARCVAAPEVPNAYESADDPVEKAWHYQTPPIQFTKSMIPGYLLERLFTLIGQPVGELY